MKYLLDTDICIYIIKKKPEKVYRTLSKTKPGDVAISNLTVAELEYGAERSSRPDQNRSVLFNFLNPFELLNFDQESAIVYGRLRMELESKGKPIGPIDTLIGSQALAHSLTLVTNNVREFRRIGGIKIENWIG